MSRKRNEFGAEGNAMLERLMHQGGTAQSISAAMTAAGIKGASRSTVDVRMRELRGQVATSRSATVRAEVPPPPSSAPPPFDEPPGLPSAPEDVPEGTSTSKLDEWIATAESTIREAQSKNNLPLVGQMLRVVAFLAEIKRKGTPPPKADPNDNPDFVRLGAEVKARLHQMIDIVCAG